MEDEYSTEDEGTPSLVEEDGGDLIELGERADSMDDDDDDDTPNLIEDEGMSDPIEYEGRAEPIVEGISEAVVDEGEAEVTEE